MAKTRTVYFCDNCGYESAKWMGKCPSCNQWNTFKEQTLAKVTAQQERFGNDNGKSSGGTVKAGKVRVLTEVDDADTERIDTLDAEFNRVLGGGVVAGSIVLIGGEPGIGKSTLLLQLALRLRNARVMYVSGEESARQVKLRADRLGEIHDHCYISTDTLTRDIFRQANELKPDLMVIDSIQTMYTDYVESTPGSITQIRECTGELMRFAKQKHIPVILVGHITKDGSIAGPKILEHMVDTVLQFEGDRNHNYRILRTVKNRFGAAAELGIYEMVSAGLQPVDNPSEVLISEKLTPLSGIAIASAIEGQRPILLEVQALVAGTAYGTPQRSSTGYDPRRANMLMAVLEKRAGFPVGLKDVFLNIAGGIRVEDPAIDLAVIAAMMSSHEDVPVDGKTAFCGEVGLSGEIRPVHRLEQRVREAAKLGFKRIYVSAYNKGELPGSGQIEVLRISNVQELYQQLFL